MHRLRGTQRRETLPADAIKEPAERQRYQGAISAVDAGDIETAIRELQWLADRDPKSQLYSIATTQVLLMYIQQHGWDMGYMERARRYLTRARGIDAEDPRLPSLERVYRALDAKTREP